MDGYEIKKALTRKNSRTQLQIATPWIRSAIAPLSGLPKMSDFNVVPQTYQQDPNQHPIPAMSPANLADLNFIKFINNYIGIVIFVTIGYIVLAISFLVLYIFVCYELTDIFTTYDPPLEILALFMGSLGAFFNMLIRYYNFGVFPEFLDPNPSSTRLKPLQVIGLLSLPTIIGAISGLVVYVIFSAGILKGALFPEFSCKISTEKCNTLISVIKYWSPKDTESYIKALFWCFIVGFSQRTMFGYLDKYINGR